MPLPNGTPLDLDDDEDEGTGCSCFAIILATFFGFAAVVFTLAAAVKWVAH